MSVLAHFLKWQFGLAKAETQTTEAERDCLALHAAGKACLAEIGVWHGVTTCRLRTVMAPAGVLYAIDPYPVGRLGVSFQKRIAHAGVGRVRNGWVEWVRTTGADAARALAPQLAGKVEFLFIDGDHRHGVLKADREGWDGPIAPGSVVGLHESRSTPARPLDDAGSARYTREVVRSDARFELADEVDSLTVMRRVAT